MLPSSPLHILLLTLPLPLTTSLTVPPLKVKPPLTFDPSLFKIDPVKSTALKSLIPDLGTSVPLPALNPDNSPNSANANVKIHLPPLSLLASDLDPSARISAALNASVPLAFKESGRGDLDATEGVQAAKEAVEAIMRGEDAPMAKLKRSVTNGEVADSEEAAGLAERGIGGIFKSIGCAIFAAATVPGYLAAASDLWWANRGSAAGVDAHGLNDDIRYHLFPVHGDLPSTGPITIHYSATRPPGFGNSAGITMNRDIYIVLPPPATFPSAAYKDPTIHQPFTSLLKLLIHETQHVQQYRSASYNLWLFAHAYLYNYCKANFSYRNNKYEAEAYSIESRMDADLTPTTPPNLFFLLWRTQADLRPRLGFPTEVGARPLGPEFGANAYEKRFQNGVMQIKDPVPGVYGGFYCLRTFSNDELANRDQPCTKELIDMCVKKAKRGQDTRIHNKDGEPVGGDPEGRINCKHPKKCATINMEKEGAWRGLLRREWRCNTGLAPSDVK